MIKSNMLKKLSVAFSALLMAGSLTACGGDEENNASACKEGQVNVGGGAGLMAGCYDTCTADANCTGGNVCRSFPGGQKLCAPPTMTSNNNPMDCEAGKVKANFMGTEQCLVDCSADAATCAATEECTTSGTAKVCTPKPAPTCMEGEVETVFAGSTKQCFKTCTGDADCTDGKVCNQDDAGVNMICTPASELETLCKQYCSTMYGECRTTNCPGLTDAQKATILFTEETCLNGIPANQIPSCEQRLAGQDGFAQAELALAQASGAECTSSLIKLRQAYGVPIIQGNMIVIGPADFAEACGVTSPSLNKPCTANAECEAGAIQASCDTEEGFCTAGACQPSLDAATRQQLMNNPMSVLLTNGDSAGCGQDTYCLVQAQGAGIASSCLEACATTADCNYGVAGDMDSGFACAGVQVGADSKLGFCEPACTTDADCPAQMNQAGMMVERTCSQDRTCQRVCDPNAMPSQCGAGDTCVEGRTAGKFGCKITPMPLQSN